MSRAWILALLAGCGGNSAVEKPALTSGPMASLSVELNHAVNNILGGRPPGQQFGSAPPVERAVDEMPAGPLEPVLFFVEVSAKAGQQDIGFVLLQAGDKVAIAEGVLQPKTRMLKTVLPPRLTLAIEEARKRSRVARNAVTLAAADVSALNNKGLEERLLEGVAKDDPAFWDVFTSAQPLTEISHGGFGFLSKDEKGDVYSVELPVTGGATAWSWPAAERPILTAEKIPTPKWESELATVCRVAQEVSAQNAVALREAQRLFVTRLDRTEVSDVVKEVFAGLAQNVVLNYEFARVELVDAGAPKEWHCPALETLLPTPSMGR